MDKHRSLFYRKFSGAAGTHFDIRSIKYQRGGGGGDEGGLFSWSYLGAWGGGQTQKCIHGVVLPGVEEGLIVLRKEERLGVSDVILPTIPQGCWCETDGGAEPQ